MAYSVDQLGILDIRIKKSLPLQFAFRKFAVYPAEDFVDASEIFVVLGRAMGAVFAIEAWLRSAALLVEEADLKVLEK
jgi:hypothetical protein